MDVSVSFPHRLTNFSRRYTNKKSSICSTSIRTRRPSSSQTVRCDPCVLLYKMKYELAKVELRIELMLAVNMTYRRHGDESDSRRSLEGGGFASKGQTRTQGRPLIAQQHEHHPHHIMQMNTTPITSRLLFHLMHSKMNTMPIISHLFHLTSEQDDVE
jgi:hypothetical protein